MGKKGNPNGDIGVGKAAAAGAAAGTALAGAVGLLGKIIQATVGKK